MKPMKYSRNRYHQISQVLTDQRPIKETKRFNPRSVKSYNRQITKQLVNNIDLAFKSDKSSYTYRNDIYTRYGYPCEKSFSKWNILLTPQEERRLPGWVRHQIRGNRARAKATRNCHAKDRK